MSDRIVDGKRAWRRAWKALDRQGRWLVRDAVDRGAAVEDPELAAVAVGRARRYRRNPLLAFADLFSGPRALLWALFFHRHNWRRSEKLNLQVIRASDGASDEA